MTYNIVDYIPPVYWMHPVKELRYAAIGLHSKRYLRITGLDIIHDPDADDIGTPTINNDFTDYNALVTDTPVAFRFKEYLYFTTAGNVETVHGKFIQPDLEEDIAHLHSLVRQRDLTGAYTIINKISADTKNALADTTRYYRAKVKYNAEITAWQL